MRRLYILTFLCISFSIYGQNKRDIANRYFKDYAYYKALGIYLELQKNGSQDAEILERIGDCYYNNSETKSSVVWYKKALDKLERKNENLILKYIQSLKSNNQYEEAFKWYNRYNNEKGLPEVIVSKSEYLTELNKLNKPITKYTKVINLEINTTYSEFGNYYKNNELYYATSVFDLDKKKSNKNYEWNNEPYLALYKSNTKFKKDTIVTQKGFLLKGDELHTRFHEANSVISRDGQTMYFTRDNLKQKRNKLNPNEEGTVHLMIYKAKLVNNIWSQIESLSFNSPNYSNGHPVLSLDNETLFFVSDRPDGFGGTDIYEVNINEDGSFGTPKNLGPEINTNGREMFPFIDSENNFYFSSDSYNGLGLLDIYKSNYLNREKNSNITVENLGAPFNSGYDDFAFFIDPIEKKGFFSSDRLGGKGSDDIYGFLTLDCKQKVNGVVTDELTKKPISDATIRLMNDEGRIVYTTTTNIEGYYEILNIPCERLYEVVVNKDNYKQNKIKLKTTDLNDKLHDANLELTPLIINDEIVINPIYFDFDKYNIRQDSFYELENIVNVLKANPNIVIKIESHTDSRGTDSYNLDLSDLRAKATLKYILSRDISTKQIESAIGYGEMQLLNKCKNNVKCTEEEHQLNRRSKFLIISK